MGLETRRIGEKILGLRQLIKQPFQPIMRARRAAEATRSLHPRTCPMCGYRGYFDAYGRPPRLDAMCRSCFSLERHRLFWLWFRDNSDKLLEPVVHFAPEKIFVSRFREALADYRTSDPMMADVDLRLDLEQLDLPDDSVGTVICNHVLEHVDDTKAMAEIYRVLKPGGLAILSVPIVEGWESTYEVDGITSEHDRELHFGQYDHVRYFGRDFRDRLRNAGFSIEEVTAEGPAVIEYGLQRGEKVFLCSK